MKKDSSTNKSEKKKTKKFQPLRRQLEFLFIGLLVLSIFSITMIQYAVSGTVLYNKQKTEVLQSEWRIWKDCRLSEMKRESRLQRFQTRYGETAQGTICPGSL